MLRKLDPARGHDSWCWPKGAPPLGTRMCSLQLRRTIFKKNPVLKTQLKLLSNRRFMCCWPECEVRFFSPLYIHIHVMFPWNFVFAVQGWKNWKSIYSIEKGRLFSSPSASIKEIPFAWKICMANKLCVSECSLCMDNKNCTKKYHHNFLWL